MMALQLLPILQVLVILSTPGAICYPTSPYGSKRYGRASAHRVTTYDPYDSMIRTQRYHPVNYYKLYPYYSQDEYYYPEDTYPVYYPPARTSKYEVYQAVLPYYYQETAPPVSRSSYNSYYGYGMDPSVDLQEEMIQEAEREQRERNQPIGHEIMYENTDGSSNEDAVLDEANAAFLQNLMMQQRYQEALKQQNNNEQGYYDPSLYDDYESVGKWEDVPYDKPSQKEDEDVRELKELVKQKQARKQKLRNKQKNDGEDVHWFQKSNSYKNNNKRNIGINDQPEGVMVYTERKPVVKDTQKSIYKTTTTTSTTDAPKREVRGQKEEVLMRPATPVRHPFSNSVIEMMSKNDVEKKRSPSVYDTIKHMLEVEKSLEEENKKETQRPPMRKRIISSDESLTRQLSVLKKSQ